LENLRKINPWSKYEIHNLEINDDNISEVFADAEILVEAFDMAEMKKMLIESWISQFPKRPIIAASGLAGFGKNEILHSRKIGSLYICGDEDTEVEEGISPMAPRVGIVSNMQANLVLELLVKTESSNK
jgi:sulfur carrier protein ThiS adenylyltransferase